MLAGNPAERPFSAARRPRLPFMPRETVIRGDSDGSAWLDMPEELQELSAVSSIPEPGCAVPASCYDPLLV